MVHLDNQTEHHLDEEIFEELADELTKRDVELIICDKESITELNRKYRSIDKGTDVLSFPIDGAHSHLPLGTIVISHDSVVDMSLQHEHSESNEYALMFIHGLLHLLGYDHETDNGEMREKEHEIIRKFDLPESLIVRTEKR